jgi:Na+/melibiose symporter-like transporter
MWTFVSKIGIALAPALVGLVLSLSGFTPDAVQTPGTLLAIRVLIGPVPVAIFLAGILIIERYPLDEMTYEGIVGKTQ